MRYLDNLIQSSFRRDAKGNLIFFHSGAFSKGRIIDSDETEKSLVHFLTRYYIISFAVTIFLVFVILATGQWLILAVAFLLNLPLYYAPLLRKISKLKISSEKFPLRTAQREYMTQYSKFFPSRLLWFFLISSLCFVLFGAFMFLSASTAEEKWLGAKLFTLFSLVSLIHAYLVKLRTPD